MIEKALIAGSILVLAAAYSVSNRHQIVAPGPAGLAFVRDNWTGHMTVCGPLPLGTPYDRAKAAGYSDDEIKATLAKLSATLRQDGLAEDEAQKRLAANTIEVLCGP